jgi:hypothetical protein
MRNHDSGWCYQNKREHGIDGQQSEVSTCKSCGKDVQFATYQEVESEVRCVILSFLHEFTNVVGTTPVPYVERI